MSFIDKINFKLVLVLLLLTCNYALYANDFDVFFELNRFFEDETKTNFEMCYKIPNSSLQFSKGEDKFIATIIVEYQFLQKGKIVSRDSYEQKIGALNKSQTLQDNNYYIHKLSFGLGQNNYDFRLIITDKNTRKRAEFSQKLDVINIDNSISDLEFSQKVVKNSVNVYPTLQRNDLVYYITPKHIYEMPYDDTVFIYYEGKNKSKDQEINLFEEKLLVSLDSELIKEYIDTLHVYSGIFNNTKRISLKGYEDGLYNASIQITDLANNTTSSTEDYFIVKNKKYFYKRIFPDLEDEYLLTKYFDNVKGWRGLSFDGKKNYLDRFWSMRNNIVDENGKTLVELVKERVHQANIKFTTFKDGWKTDMGRIFIRNGEPYEIEKYVTDTTTKYTRKDYQIWKYRQKINRTYIFIDFQSNKNFRLVHDINDDMETSDSQWKEFLGSSFDESILDD